MKHLSKYSILLLIWQLICWPGLIALAQVDKSTQPQSRDFVQVGEILNQQQPDKAALPELWAVVVGVSEFQFGDQSASDVRIKNLRYAARDAEAVYDFLVSENGGFKKDHVRKLINSNATKANVEAALTTFLAQAKEQDYIFLFFASHGAYSPDQTGPTQTPYLVMHDTDPRRLAQTGLGVDTIAQSLKNVKARRGLFISDACHSGGLEFANGRSSADEALVRNYLRERVANSKEGIVYLSAANSVEKSYEYPELEHGVFTYYLLEGLRGQARGARNDAITVRDLWVYVQKRVAERTENRQHPTIGQNRYDPDLVVSVMPRNIAASNTGGTDGGGNASLGTLSITIRDEDGVEVLIDGKPIDGRTVNSDKSVSLLLSPGSHTIEARKGARIFKKVITINPGKTTALPIRLPLPMAMAEPSAEITKQFQEGVKLYEQFKFKEAIEKFNDIIRQQPGFPDAHGYLGRAEFKSRHLDNAIAAYDKAIELDPINTRYMVLKAEVLLEKGDLGGSEDLLKEAINDDPEDGLAPLVLGYNYYLNNRYNEAEDQIQMAVNREPTNPICYLQLGQVLRARNEIDRAVEATRKAIQLFNDFSQQQNQQKKDSAWKSLFMSTKMIQFIDKSGLADAHLQLGTLLMERAMADNRLTAMPAEAVTNIDKAYELADKSKNRYLLAQASHYRGEIYRFSQQFDRAIASYQQAIQNNGELAMPYRGLSWCYEKQQKFQQALSSYQQYVAKLNRTELEEQRDQIDRRMKRLQNVARAHK